MARISCALLVICAVFVSSTFATAMPQRRAMAVKEQRPVPQGFAKIGKPSQDVNLRIALAPQDRHGLETELYDVSTPGNAKYGQHLTKDAVTAYLSPNEESIKAVTDWLSENGVTDIKPSGAFNDWLDFTVPVSKADSLFKTDFEKFQKVSSGEQVVRTLQYSIPQDLLGHISLVHPTTSFALKPATQPPILTPVPNLSARANPAPASCIGDITPACLQALYGIPTTPATQSSNTLAVTGFIDEFAQEADLQSFLTALRPDMNPNTTFTVQSVDGGSNPQGPDNAGIEANLDIQYTVGIATGVPVTFVTVGEDNADGVSGFLDVINVLLGEDTPPPVLSTSYGFDESDLGPEVAGRICDAYMALGARGVSNLFASGDGGVWGSRDNQCTDFVPTFPGGCPFVTAVGSTSPGSSSAADETASDFSSGGFSNFFSRPSYQDDAVTGYLSAIGSANSGKFNVSNRGYPDISAVGTPVQIWSGGQAGLVQGTSCSTPIFASVIALINDRLVAAGKPVLGFLNPFLYANPQALFDTTAGTNNGPNCQSAGFDAVSGWDASTGLGTPNFDALLTAAGL